MLAIDHCALFANSWLVMCRKVILFCKSFGAPLFFRSFYSLAWLFLFSPKRLLQEICCRILDGLALFRQDVKSSIPSQMKISIENNLKLDRNDLMPLDCFAASHFKCSHPDCIFHPLIPPSQRIQQSFLMSSSRSE